MAFEHHNLRMQTVACKYRAVQTKLYNDFCDINNPQFDFSIVFFGLQV